VPLPPLPPRPAVEEGDIRIEPPVVEGERSWWCGALLALVGLTPFSDASQKRPPPAASAKHR
jgi:hypothetical protein